MASAARYLLFFFVSLNLIAAAMLSTGVAASMGLEGAVSDSDEVSERADTGDLQSGAPTSDTLFGLYNVVTSQLTGLFAAIYPGLNILARIPGFPDWVITILGGAISVVISFAAISFIRGYSA
jgi:hypothetical protein